MVRLAEVFHVRYPWANVAYSQNCTRHNCRCDYMDRPSSLAEMDRPTVMNPRSRINISQTIQPPAVTLNDNKGQSQAREGLSLIERQSAQQEQPEKWSMQESLYAQVPDLILLQNQRKEDSVLDSLKRVFSPDRLKKDSEIMTRPTESDKIRKDDLADEIILFSRPETLPKNSWHTDVDYIVSSSTKTQWWCGNCKKGPMSVKFQFACYFCHHCMDFSAYHEDPRNHITWREIMGR